MTLDATALTTRESIAPFTGGISKNHDPGSATYSTGVTTLQSYDIGDDGVFIPVRLHMPTSGTSNLFPETKLTYHDASTTTIQNSSPLSVRNDTFQDLMDAILGGATDSATNNGTGIKTITFQINNQTGTDQTTDLDAYRVRAFTTARGNGTSP